MTFDDLRLSEPILRAVRSQGYTQPTPIQQQALPHVAAGKDVLGCAQTGTGKTAAFALPIIHRLATSPNAADAARRNGRRHRASGQGGRSVRALVLAPTRELAAQIQESFATYGQHTSIRAIAIFGGVNQNPQVQALREGVDVLVATPGRLLDLLGQRLVDLGQVEVLVLDEADRMLDMGFLPDIRRILKTLPEVRQNLLFSATMPAPIRKLADDILRDAAYVEANPVSSAAPQVSHWVHHVAKADKPDLLTCLLHDTPFSRALIFTRTKHGADKVVRKLSKAGLPAVAIHGNKSQNARTRALEQFRSARSPVMVATDIAARGIDVDDISHVINFDLTSEPEVYVHRIGRTGRAGASGAAISFCTEEDRDSLRAIERLIDGRLKEAEAPSGYVATHPVRQPATRERSRNSNAAVTRRPSPTPQDSATTVESPRRRRRKRSSRQRRRSDSTTSTSPRRPASAQHGQSVTRSV